MRRSPATGLALVAILATACSGGGGGGLVTTEVEPPLDQGSYAIEDFAPPPERPAGYQPLGTAGYQALSRDELFVIAPTADTEGRIARLQDDLAAGQQPLDLVPLFAGEGTIHAVGFGQLDDDADEEMVVATVDASETRIDLHRVERSAGGGPLQRVWFRSLDAKPWNFEDVRVVLADVDGDFVDEVLVAARAQSYGWPASGGAVWVLDDPAAGAAELLAFDRNASHVSIDPLPVDIDGDGMFEVAVGLGGAAGISVDGLCLHALRATAATNALEHEADIAYVQEWLGHANISTTRPYDRRRSPTFKFWY